VLKARSQFLASVLFLLDLVVLAGSWIWAYNLRFAGWPVPVLHGVPELGRYLVPLLFVPPLWAVLFRHLRLYRPGSLDSSRQEIFALLRATTLAVLCMLAASYFFMKLDLSRVFLVYFWVLATVNLVVVRVAFRSVVLRLRQRDHRRRRVLIVGTGDLAEEVRRRLELHTELGLEVRGFLARSPDQLPTSLDRAPVLGNFADLRTVLRTERIDIVFFALPIEAQVELNPLLAQLDQEMVDVKVVPDLYRYALLRSSVEEFEGLPVLSLNDSPMVGWSRVAKRGLDLAVGIPALVLALPILAVVAILVRASSGKPVLYTQERMGLDGRTFPLRKFRTMRPNAESVAGPVWAKPGDSRCTPLGKWLRRTSLDELPQLWNVIRGEMSLVGPRPERPVFIQDFRSRIPKYMLRHRVKAGITGWAQVNGWRGDTSIERRLDHDLHYIQNWSVGLDLKILWLTLLRGFVNKNAY